MAIYSIQVVETATADGALTRGYGVALSALGEGTAAADLVEAADECNGVCQNTVADGEPVPIVTFGECDVYMADTTAARGKIKCHTDGTWLAADANNAQAWLLTGGATGIQKAFFVGPFQIVAPST